jgi:hypothetical protein
MPGLRDAGRDRQLPSGSRTIVRVEDQVNKFHLAQPVHGSVDNSALLSHEQNTLAQARDHVSNVLLLARSGPDDPVSTAQAPS